MSQTRFSLFNQKGKFSAIPLVFIFLIFSALFLNKLTTIPPGINLDEASIGYNASLIARTLRDENGRLLPIFTLTLEGRDWKQPLRIYTTALLFRLFGASYFNLKLVSVIFVLSSGFIFYRILRLFFNKNLSLAGLCLFFASPSILLQSHLALENVDLLPFFLAWLFYLLSYSQKAQKRQLLLSGISLGFSFYAYKGMRAMTPVFLGLSLIFIVYLNFFKKKPLGQKKDLLYFLLGITPFLLPLKWLQTHYAGAIYSPADVFSPPFYDLVSNYLSLFDFSFLFLRGDKMLLHSTGRHGLFLIPSLILLFLGFAQLIKEKKPAFYLIFFSLILSPLFLTVISSVGRASRLMVFIPPATFIFVLGLKTLFAIRRKSFRWFFCSLLFLALFANYLSFLQTYWQKYPQVLGQEISPNLNQAFQELNRLVKEQKKQPYFEIKGPLKNHFAGIQFFNEVYFPGGNLSIWDRSKEAFPEIALVLTGVSGSGDLVNLVQIPGLVSGQEPLFVVGSNN